MSGDGNGFNEWGGYMEAKVTKLEEQFATASDPFRKSNLFSGISIYVNGLTNPSADELKRIMMVHGGTYHHYKRSHTTYIIASNLPDVKVRNMDTSRIISPQWVVDCVRENRILDFTKYLLYSNQKTTQPKLTFAKPSHESVNKGEQLATIMSSLMKLNAQVKENLAVLKPTLAINPKVAEQLTKANVEVTNTTQVAGQTAEDIKQLKSDNEDASGANEQKAMELEDDDDVQIIENESVPQLLIIDSDEEVKTETENIETAQAVKNESKTASASESMKGQALTAVNKDFLKEFFKNSRLHHIATLGIGFKQYVSDLRAQHGDEGFPARAKLREKLLSSAKVSRQNNANIEKLIMHIDMDCFFVSVGLRKRQHLLGKPVAVTHSRGGPAATNVPQHVLADREAEKKLFLERTNKQQDFNKSEKISQGFDTKLSLSEIACCSYEARAMGVRNGMFVGQALQLCPHLITMQYDFEDYKNVATALYNIIARYTLEIEAVSCDEMFVDLTDILKDIPVSVTALVRAIRKEVFNETGCPCSAGIGANKLQARMATKLAKPNGQYHIEKECVLAYMSSIPVEELTGVGNHNAQILKNAGLSTCGDLQLTPLKQLQDLVGPKFGETLHQFCRGIDTRPLQYAKPRQTVSVEVNYGIRFTKEAEVEFFLRQLCEELHDRLIAAKRTAKSVTLKVMVRATGAPMETSKFMGHGVCDTVARSFAFPELTNDLDVIIRHVLKLRTVIDAKPKDLRGIGVQLTKLNDLTEKKPKTNVLKDMFSKMQEKQNPTNTSAEMQNEPTTSAAAAAAVAPASIKPMKSPPKAKAEPNRVGKSSPGKRTSMAPQKRGHVLDMLQNAAAKRGRPEMEPKRRLPPDIDPNVFNELPSYIQAEILSQYGLPQLENEQNIVYTPQKLSFGRMFPSPERLPNMPPYQIDPDNIFGQENTRELLLGWVKSTNDPVKYDMNLLIKHACEFLHAFRLIDLYSSLHYLVEVVEEQGNCNWHIAINEVLAGVQAEMRTFYNGRSLLFDFKVHCTKCDQGTIKPQSDTGQQ